MEKEVSAKKLLNDSRLRLVARENFLLKHNVHPYYNVAKSFKEGNNRAAIVHAVGTGKSFIAIQWLVDEINGAIVCSNIPEEEPVMVTKHKDAKVLYLAPKLAAFAQIKRHIDAVGATEIKDNIEFVTYSGLLSKFKKFKGDFDLEDDIILSAEEETEFEEYIKQFTHIVVDEFHHADENKWGHAVKHALNSSNAKVLGLTATPIRSTGTNTVDTIFNGNVVSTISLADAIVEEILPFPNYQSSVYSYDKLIEKYIKRIDKIQNEEKRIEATKKVNEIRKYITEAQTSADILAYNFQTRPNGKFVVFCEDILTSQKCIKDLVEIVEDAGLELSALYNVNSSNENALQEIEEFERINGEGLKLLFAVDMLNETVHIKGLDGVIMLRDTQSFIVYVQQIGRALSAGGQQYPLVLDLVNNIDSAFEYREDREGLVKLFKEVAERTQNETIKNLAMKAIQENKIMAKLRELDEMVGVKIDESLKLEILTSLKNHGYDLNKLHKYRYNNTDAVFEYQGEEYRIFKIYDWIKKAKEGLYSEDFKVKLSALGVDFEEKVVDPSKKIEILKEAIASKCKGITTLANGKIKIVQNTFFKGYPIGYWCEYVKGGKSKEEGLREKMEELNIDFERVNKTIPEKIEIIKAAIANKAKGIKFKEDGTILINNNCVYGEDAIGKWIEKAKTRPKSNRELLDFLFSINVDISAKHLTPQEKLKILRNAIEEKVEGVKQQEDGSYRISSFAVYQGYYIGRWILAVKRGSKVHKDFIDGLKKLNIDVSKEKITTDEKLSILSQAIAEKTKGVTFNENGTIRIADKCVFNGHLIGGWVTAVKSKMVTDVQFIEGLKSMNIDLTVEKRLTPSQKIDIIARAIKEKNEWIHFREDKKIVIAFICEFEGYKIGQWVASIRNGQTTNKEFKQALIDLNIDIETDFISSYSVDFKINIIKEAIDNKIKGISVNKNGLIDVVGKCAYIKDGKKYEIGSWIDKAKYRETTNLEFIEKLKKLNINLERVQIPIPEKLKIIEKALKTPGVKGIILLDNGKFKVLQSTEFEGYRIGQWIQGVRQGSTTNKDFIQGIIDLNVDIPDGIIDSFLL